MVPIPFAFQPLPLGFGGRWISDHRFSGQLATLEIFVVIIILVVGYLTRFSGGILSALKYEFYERTPEYRKLEGT